MKKLIFALILLSCTPASNDQVNPVTVQIIQHNSGFEIYTDTGALLLEILPSDDT